MDINKLTVGECWEIASMEIAALLNAKNACAKSDSHPFEVGENYYIRTVTLHFTGKLEEVHAGELVLSTCAWIPDHGRFAQAVDKGTFNKVEPYPPDARVIINRASLVDAVKIGFKLPVSQK